MTAAFFTKLITTQQHGPNMHPPTEGECLVLYVCDRCEDEHQDEFDARECCKPDVYEIYRCGVCRKKHNDQEAATACHPAVAIGQPMQCPVCLKGADDFEAAADCCLHTHPTITAYDRELIAKAVANGATWAEAIEQHQFH